MSYKLDFSTVTITGREGLDTVFGTIENRKIEVRRRLQGWDARLSIIVDGVQVHNSSAETADKAAYERLIGRAFDEERESQEKTRQIVLGSRAFKALFNN